MWRWDQGHRAYFEFDSLRQIAAFAVRHNFKTANRQMLKEFTGLPFAAPSTHSPWRNYSRTLKLCLLVSEAGEVARPTRIGLLLANPGAVTSDEYLQFFARAFTDPSPALDGWDPRAHFRYPLLFAIRYVLTKAAILGEVVTSLREIFAAYKQTAFTGEESETEFIEAVGRHRRYQAAGENLQENCRQARESLKMIARLSYFHLGKSHLLVASDAASILPILRDLRPVRGPRALDREVEIRRIADQFRVEDGKIFENYLNNAANDVIQSGFLEGTKVKKTHLVIERNQSLKKAYFDFNPAPLCDICALDTKATYPWAKRVLDLHHLLPLSSGIKVKKSSTTLDDLVAVCPSCHRAIHRFYDQWLSKEGLLDFPNESLARGVYQDLKAGFRGAIHA